MFIFGRCDIGTEILLLFIPPGGEWCFFRCRVWPGALIALRTKCDIHISNLAFLETGTNAVPNGSNVKRALVLFTLSFVGVYSRVTYVSVSCVGRRSGAWMVVHVQTLWAVPDEPDKISIRYVLAWQKISIRETSFQTKKSHFSSRSRIFFKCQKPDISTPTLFEGGTNPRT